MKKVSLIILAVFGSISAFSAELKVSQQYVTPYYAEFVAPEHAQTAFEFMDETLRAYDCLAGEAQGYVSKKARTRIFGRDTPGEYTLTYKTKCFSPDLKSVRFYVDAIGYDEDYTQIVLEIDTKSRGKIYPEICAYGLDGRARKCPAGMFERPTTFSKSIP